MDLTGATPLITRWWGDDVEKGERHTVLQSIVSFLRDQDAGRRARFLRMSGLYADAQPMGLGPDQYNKITEDGEGRLKLNVVRNMVDSVHAKIAKNKPRAQVITDGGDFMMQRRAKRLDDFLWGLFHKADVHTKMRDIFRDAAVWGTGVLKVCEDPGQGTIDVERVYPWSIYTDPTESYHGKPRSLYQDYLVDRHVLLSLVERWHAESGASKSEINRLKARIREAPRAEGEESGADRFADMVMVTEAWHLPSGPKSEDGTHVITIEGADLWEHPWKDAEFPFVFLTWSKPLIGMWGTSLAQEAEGIQKEITELIKKIQIGMYFNAVPIRLEQRGSNVSVHTNDPKGCRVVYDGTPPQYVTGVSGLGPEVFNHLERLFNFSFQEQGVSQLSATSRKPPGVEAAVAMRELNDIESERFFPKGQEYEEVAVRLGKQLIWAARRLSEMGVEVEVRSQVRKRRKTQLERIKWSEVDLDADVFELKVFPANALPKSPPVRLQMVQELVSGGLIPGDQALRLLDFPDIDSAISREIAPFELVLDVLEKIVEEDKVIAPEPFMDLSLALKVARPTLLRLQIDDAPEDTLELLRNWIQAADSLLQSSLPPTPEAGAPGPEAPPAPGPGAPVPLPTEVAA